MSNKILRMLICFPPVFLCLFVGGWVADVVWPQGMSFGTPFDERVRAPLHPSYFPIDSLVLTAFAAASLLLADLITPHRARIAALCLGALFAGGLYYELFLGNFIDTLFADWPTPIGEVGALSSLLWPHVIVAAPKQVWVFLRVP